MTETRVSIYSKIRPNNRTGNASTNDINTRRIRVQASSSASGTAYSTFNLSASAEL